jgi:hypothetical protein
MRLFIFFAFFAFFQLALASGSPACDASPKTFFGSNSHGDVGCFQPGEENFLILRAGNKASVVSRWRSSYGNKYRIWDNVKDSAVSLARRSSFDSALVHFGNRAPDKDWCEIVEDPWSEWVSTTNPTQCGLHTIVQNRTCSSVGKAAKPCPDTCTSATESRTITIDNGSCNTPPTIFVDSASLNGNNGTVFSPSFTFYDADGDDVEARWTGSNACVGVYNTSIWLRVSDSVGPRFRREIQPKGGVFPANLCKIQVWARDAYALGNAGNATGVVSDSCTPQVFTAPNGSTPSEYSLTCSAPAEFTITDQCGVQEDYPCEGDSPIWSDWMQHSYSFYYHIVRTGVQGQGPVQHSIAWEGGVLDQWLEPKGELSPVDKTIGNYTYRGGSIFEGPYSYSWQKRAVKRIINSGYTGE